MSTTVLVVDDEPAIRQMLADYLRADGFDPSTSPDGTSALAHLETHTFDVVLLDLTMPGMTGLDVLAEIRRRHNVAVIVLTARADETDKVLGLGLGADDYITKPFSPREVAARIRAVLRRGTHQPLLHHDSEPVLRFGSLEVDPDSREVRIDGVTVTLTTREFDVLVALAQSPGRVFSRRVLLERIWGQDFFGDDRIIDVHIRNVRRAIGDDANNPSMIATVRGVGYKFIGHQ
jgi:DNA-binding response OmpR family regulator